MQELVFTLFKNVTDTKGEQIKKTWSEWTSFLSKHQVRGSPKDTSNKQILEKNKNGPALVLGELQGRRKSDNVTFVSALALDLENMSDEKLGGILEDISGFEWCLYSTHKHGSAVVDGRSRLRIILPLAEPVFPKDYSAAWNGLQTLVHGANDKSTFDLARLHFLPSTFDPALTITHHNEGRFISLEELAPLADAEPETPDEPVKELTTDEIQLMLEQKIRNLPVNSPVKLGIKSLINGKELANPGERHSKILFLTMWLASKLPRLNRKNVEKLFFSSIKTMSIEPEAPTLDEVWRAYEGALNKVEDEKPKKKQKDWINPTNPYTQEELETIARRQGWGPHELIDKWIIQKDGSSYILVEGGGYDGPYSRDDTPIAIRKFLARAPIRLFFATPSGYKMRSPSEVVAEHGSLAKKVVADLSAQFTTYDQRTRILREAVVPIREELKPKENPKIDGWLRALGGENHSKLVDWLSCCPDPSRQLCALYLDGSKESGKTLFAVGAARLWTTGAPAEVEEVLANFNEELTRCPLVFADEALPKRYGDQSASAKLRALLGVKERTLKRKYKTNADLTGALRLVLAANNESLLDSLDASTPADMEAIAQRFLYVKITDASAAYLLKNCTKAELEGWAVHGIAEHALWLQANHSIKKPGRRFWVEGDLTEIHRLLLTGGHWTSLVCDWLIRYLINPRPLHADAEVTGLVRIEDGQLLVNEQVLADKWKLYLPNTRQDPVVRQIGHALRAVSFPERRQLRWNRRRVRYRSIDPSHLIAWSERHGIGDEQIIRDRLDGVIPLTVSLESENYGENGQQNQDVRDEGF